MGATNWKQTDLDQLNEMLKSHPTLSLLQIAERAHALGYCQDRSLLAIKNKAWELKGKLQGSNSNDGTQPSPEKGVSIGEQVHAGAPASGPETTTGLQGTPVGRSVTSATLEVRSAVDNALAQLRETQGEFMEQLKQISDEIRRLEDIRRRLTP